MHIPQTQNVQAYGAQGYVTINNERLAIIKKISTQHYIVINNRSQIFFLDTEKNIFELIFD